MTHNRTAHCEQFSLTIIQTNGRFTIVRGPFLINTHPLLPKDFILGVIGQIISLFGSAVLRFALPLYLLWETGSAILFGLVTACSFLPMIVLSFLGGGLADRVNKHNIMVFFNFGTPSSSQSL